MGESDFQLPHLWHVGIIVHILCTKEMCTILAQHPGTNKNIRHIRNAQGKKLQLIIFWLLRCFISIFQEAKQHWRHVFLHGKSHHSHGKTCPSGRPTDWISNPRSSNDRHPPDRKTPSSQGHDHEIYPIGFTLKILSLCVCIYIYQKYTYVYNTGRVSLSRMQSLL